MLFDDLKFLLNKYFTEIGFDSVYAANVYCCCFFFNYHCFFLRCRPLDIERYFGEGRVGSAAFLVFPLFFFALLLFQDIFLSDNFCVINCWLRFQWAAFYICIHILNEN